MYIRNFLFTRRNLINYYNDNSIYRSIVPKCNNNFKYSELYRFYITNNKINNVNNNKFNKENNLNFNLSKIRYITVNNFNPIKNPGFFDKVISCGKLMRIHNLVPVVIFALPAMWSCALALPPIVTLIEFKKILLMCLGTFFARSAGCCVNDLADRNFDKMVERTKIRPLASGSIGTKEALITLAFNGSMGLLILLQFDPTTVSLGILTAISCSIYPFMKRFIKFPQLILGLSSSIGTLMAWTAISGNPITAAPICIYLTSSIWSLIYDTIYAHQDIEDDKKLGLGSLAIEWGDKTKKMCNLVAWNMSILMATCGYFAKLSDPFYISVILSHLWMLKEIKNVNLKDPANCFLFFKKSVIYGSILLSGILLGKKNLSIDLKSNKYVESNI